MDNFHCGHVKTFANTIHGRHDQCRICYNQRKDEQNLPKLSNPDYTHHDPEEVAALSNRTFMRAMFREHPHIMAYAKKAGRLVVFPQ